MTNAEIYTKVFTDLFAMSADEVQKLHYQDIKEWDSVGHMTLISSLEDTFDIEMDTDDIIDFDSYEKGKELLKKYDIDVNA